MEEIIAQASFQYEHHFQAGEVARRIDLSAIGCVVLDERQLWQFDILVDDQRHVRVPLEYHVIRCMRHCKRKIEHPVQ